MKLLHTGDLHIGKKIFELSMLEEQKNMLQQIYEVAKDEKVDAVLIAGDVYDRSVPSTEAVELLDEFLTTLIQAKVPVILISGNHDSPERVGFADKILEKQGLYIASAYEGELKKVALQDDYGEVCIICLPFIKPAVVEGRNCAEAVAHILEKEALDFKSGKRYCLLAHYFVTGTNGEIPQLSESETMIDVGGIDNVPAQLFAGFDYVALGHIHRYQQIGEGQIFYSGTPLKYSFSEVYGEKSVNIVELKEKGQVEVRRRFLKPLHEMRCIKGKLHDLIAPEVVGAAGVSAEDYIQATLTNKEELIDPIGTLRSVYPNTLQILMERSVAEDVENMESRLRESVKSVDQLFAQFYEMLTGESLSEKQRLIVKETLEEEER